MRKKQISMTKKKDRLSDLPDHLIHKIMSFLQPRQTLKFQILSKRLSCIWLTFHTLQIKSAISNGRELNRFSDHTRFILRRRNNTPLQTLIFSLQIDTFNWDYYSTLYVSVKKLLEEISVFAVENRLSSLSISCHDDPDCSIFPSKQYRTSRSFSASVFSLATIRKMNLEGLKVKSCELRVDCPLIEDFTISFCSGVKSLEFSRDAKLLKSVSVSQCRGVERVRIGECQSRVASFTYEACKGDSCKIEIDRACHERLEILKLSDNLEIDDDWVQNNLADCVSIEILELYNCRKVRSLWLSNSRLRCLTLVNSERLGNIDLSVPSLKRLKLFGPLYENEPRKINITVCTNLESLELTGFVLSKQWITDNLAGLSSLENLKLKNCKNTDCKSNMRFCLEKLRSFELTDKCPWEFNGFQIECPKLASFKYNGRQMGSKPVVIASSLKDAKISFSYPNSCYFTRLQDYIYFSGICNTLFLTAFDGKDFVVPENLRNCVVRRKNELKHLKIPFEYLWCTKSKRIVEFVESLLWLAHRPETISFIGKYGKFQLEKAFIKLNYCSSKASTEVLGCCSRKRKVKCWRHGLTEVVFQNFTKDKREILLNHFVKNTEAIITFESDQLI